MKAWLPRSSVVLLFTWATFCVKPKPTSWVLATEPPKLATPVTLMAGPVPDALFAARLCARVAYWTRNSLSMFEPIVEINCAPAECWRSAKSLARCTDDSPPPTLAVMKLSKNM